MGDSSMGDVAVTTVSTMLSPSLQVYSVSCAGDGARRPVDFAPHLPYELCLVRRGCFRYRDRRGTVLVDPTTALFGDPDDGDYEVDHPYPGGDRDTFIRFDASALAAVAGGDVTVPAVTRTTPWLELTHRRLLVTATLHPHSPLVEELAMELVAAAVAASDPKRVAAGGPETSPAARRMVDDARAALCADPDLSLLELAAAVGCGPHHLSRLFRRRTGVGVAAYRIALRAQQALDGLSEGAPSLADLASACGFYDHAHLTRTLVDRFGVTPSALRAEWAPGVLLGTVRERPYST